MNLRPYQEDAISSIYSYFEEKTGNPVVAMPTGTGKSVVIGEFVRSVFTQYQGQRILMLTHVKELIQQNFNKLLQLWPMAPAGIFSAGLGRKEVRPITFAGIASVVKKAALFGHIDLVLIDECHLVSPHDNTSYRFFLDELKSVNPLVKVVGFSATPYRLGQGLLTDSVTKKDKELPSLFTELCYDLTGLDAFNQLIADGYLSELIPKRTSKEIDVSGVGMVGGEFNQQDLQAVVDREEVTYGAVQEMIQLGSDRKHWLVFATGIEHSEHVAAMLDSLGISARAIHSKLASSELRDTYIQDFKDGKIRCLVNNNVLTTGFDMPGIDLIGMLRPTSSPGLWVQMLGRGTRPCPGKQNCLVLDFAGNTRRLGPINDPVLPKRKGSKGGGSAPVKCCENCGTYNHASVRICISCGQEFPKHTKFKSTSYTDELIARPEKEPVFEIFPVNHVTYHRHTKADKPLSIKVSYSCGLYVFNEWVCLEHVGFAAKKAREWWRARVEQKAEPPSTTIEALACIEKLKTPTHIRVQMDQKNPRIVGFDFKGTAFQLGKPKPTPPGITDEEVPF